MENKSNVLQELSEEIKDFAELKSEDLKLAAIEKTALLSSFFSSGLIVFFLICIIITNCSFALVLWIGKMLNNYSLGMGIVGAFFLIVLLVYLLAFKNAFKTYFTNKVISILAK